ncbi:hypothetical protein LCGC14_2719860 [marine sediment metagenome]|uniref:Uncharacterized protein n=1 Tax=marine sediment metagenome TaxID=412755 RepID=A0A0F8ZAA1_9ZZZZ
MEAWTEECGVHKDTLFQRMRRGLTFEESLQFEYRSHAKNKKSHCKYGHPYSGENLRTLNSGARICRQCQSDRNKAWRKRHGLNRGNFNSRKKECPAGHEYIEPHIPDRVMGEPKDDLLTKCIIIEIKPTKEGAVDDLRSKEEYKRKKAKPTKYCKRGHLKSENVNQPRGHRYPGCKLCRLIVARKAKDKSMTKDLPDHLHGLRIALARLRRASFRGITIDGTTKTREEWAKPLGITGSAFGARLKTMSLEDAVTSPKYKKTVRPTHCRRGHELNAENVYIIPKTGIRRCRQCKLRDGRNYYRRKTGQIKEVGNEALRTTS